MKTREDIDAWLLRFGQPYRELSEATWLVGDSSGMRENIVVALESSLCHVRMKVLDVEQIVAARRAEFFETLLELNATDLVFASYALSEGAVLLTRTLMLETLDYAELASSLEDFRVALVNHHPRLAAFGPTPEHS
jgi:hypothetical protein